MLLNYFKSMIRLLKKNKTFPLIAFGKEFECQKNGQQVFYFFTELNSVVCRGNRICLGVFCVGAVR